MNPQFPHGAIAAAASALVLAAAGLQSRILADWWLENLVIAAFVAVLGWQRHRFPLQPHSYWLLFALLAAHEYGAMHAYATPLGEWMRTAGLSGSRNGYDRLVHFLYGLLALPAFVDLRKGRVWLALETVLSTSAIYEMLEWVVAGIVDPALGAEFVGAQGDDFDAAKDMACALAGALLTAGVLYFRKSSVSRTNSSN